MKLKVSNECILCGACVQVEGSKLKLVNGKIKADGDYPEKVAKEIIEICPVEAIEKA